MTTMKRFDEALLDFENAIIERSMAGSSPYFARYHDKCMAARSALVEYVRERVEAERHATRALVYLAGKLSKANKLSTWWIEEALSETNEVPR